MTKKGTYITMVGLAFLLALSVSLNIWFFRRPTDTIPVKVEVHDTIRIPHDSIIEHTRTLYKTKFDTVFVYQTDTDTIEVPVELPIEHKLYSDTLKTDTTEIELAIKYSGFKPSLDEVGISYHYRGERAVEAKKSGFGGFVGVCAYTGVGLGYNPIEKNCQLGVPEVGIGICVGWGYHW